MLWSNHYRYRAELLWGFLDQNPNSERFKVIADALGLELEAAYNALVAEIADSYQISDKTFDGLSTMQKDMLEVRLLSQWELDDKSWLNQIRYLNQLRPGPISALSEKNAAPSVQLIGTDRKPTNHSVTAVDRSTLDASWYQSILQQWDAMTETLRQASINE